MEDLGLRNTAPLSSNEPTDESYKRIIPGQEKDIPDIPAGAAAGSRFFFRWSDPGKDTMRHGMKFWVNTGIVKTDGTMIRIPLVSPNPFGDFMIQGRKGWFVGRSAAGKGCLLSKLADQRHAVIANRVFQGKVQTDGQGNVQKDVSPFHTIRVQIIDLVRGGDGKIVMDGDRPKFKVDPQGYGLEFRQNWWEQFVNLLEPAPVMAAEDDGMSAATPAPPAKDLKKFMADNKITDLSRVIFIIYKRKKDPTKPAEGLNTEYVVDFSDKVWLTDADVVEPVDPLDWNKVYHVATPEELEGLIAKAENRSVAGAAVPAPAGSGTPAPSPDSPAAYLGSAQVPVLDGAGPTNGGGTPPPPPNGDPF